MNKRSESTLSSGAAEVNISTIDPTISEAITCNATALIGGLTDNLTQVIESRLDSFQQCFSEENSATVEQAMKKARTCKLHMQEERKPTAA